MTPLSAFRSLCGSIKPQTSLVTALLTVGIGASFAALGPDFFAPSGVGGESIAGTSLQTPVPQSVRREVHHDFGTVIDDGEWRTHSFSLPSDFAIDADGGAREFRLRYQPSCCFKVEVQAPRDFTKRRIVMSVRSRTIGHLQWIATVIDNKQHLDLRAAANIVPSIGWDLSGETGPSLWTGESKTVSVQLVVHQVGQRPKVSPKVSGMPGTEVVPAEPTLEAVDHGKQIWRWTIPLSLHLKPAMTAGPRTALLSVEWGLPAQRHQVEYSWLVKAPLECKPSALIFRGAEPREGVVEVRHLEGRPFEIVSIVLPAGYRARHLEANGAAAVHRFKVTSANAASGILEGRIETNVGHERIALCTFAQSSHSNVEAEP